MHRLTIFLRQSEPIVVQTDRELSLAERSHSEADYIFSYYGESTARVAAADFVASISEVVIEPPVVDAEVV